MEKIIAKYQKLFSLSFKHEAFKKNLEKNWLSITPTRETNILMNEGNMIFKENESGFVVFVKTKNEIGKEREPQRLINNVKLYFLLEYKTPIAASVSALPTKDTKKYFFSNKKAFDAGLNNGLLCIKPNSLPSLIAGEIVEDGSNLKISSIDFESNISPRPLKLEKINGENFATTTNLTNIINPEKFGLNQSHWGLVEIQIGKFAELGHKYKLLLSDDSIEAKDFEIKVMKTL